VSFFSRSGDDDREKDLSPFQCSNIKRRNQTDDIVIHHSPQRNGGTEMYVIVLTDWAPAFIEF